MKAKKKHWYDYLWIWSIVYFALGFGGEGFCTFTIASRTGEGLTSASTFTKRRRCVMTDSLCIR